MSWSKRVIRTVSYCVTGFSFYLVPLAIVVLSLAILSQENRYRPQGQQPVSFRALQQDAPELAPSQALRSLAAEPLLQTWNTRLSEDPVWMHIALSTPPEPEDTRVLEFTSRHTIQLSCWSTPSLTALGQAGQRGAQGLLQPLKAGYALPLEGLTDAAGILCRGIYSGPALISVLEWQAPELQKSVMLFQRNIGLLEGGLLTLAVFILMAALVNREARYVLFAAWLVGNLRLSALSMGWDTEWLLRAVPSDWLATMRQLTMASYYLLTYTLFNQFFKSELARVGYGWLLRVVLLTGVLLLVLALTLPYATFLPIMWVLVAIGAGGVVFFLTRLLIVARSRIALWYSAALTLVLFATFGEVVAAAIDFQLFSSLLNSVTAALAASLMTAVAFAEQMRAERAQRRQAQAELHGAYQVAPTGLFTLEMDGAFVRVNPAMQRYLGIDPERASESHWDDYFPLESWQTLLEVSSQPEGGETELFSRARDGVESRGYLLKATRTGERIEGSLQDITERLKATERLRFLANHDSLTNALNRRGIEHHLLVNLAALSNGQELALAYLDLDRFKLINDLYGHHIGDDVLKQVYQRIRQVLPSRHAVGRLGGDEFLVVMPATSVEEGRRFGLAILDAINGNLFRLSSRAFQVKVSVGVIDVTPQMSASEAISAADRACREAKRRPQLALVVYERNAPEFRQRTEELALIEELGSAFSAKGLFLEMQPIMSLRNPTRALDFEILLRMRDSSQQLVPPGKILAAALAAGHMGELDKWVLRTTLDWLRIHAKVLVNTRFVCVNLSGSSLNDEAFIDDMFALLARYEDVSRFLCIEITESVALHDLDNTRRVIEALRKHNIRIALDDFGAGYTSFSYLKQLSADAVKIDGSFIRSMNQHPIDIAIVETIVELTHNLGMRSIAEWVEDWPTLEALSEIGVDYVQGYLVARPQPPEAILSARSAADFITDPDLLRFVREASEKRLSIHDDPGEPPTHYH